ncbi:hypothetical protein HT102_00465 [Hoyosella sp. G463]|uniref:RNA polymerase sigma-70 domain-containing protein n=1 Tax=Lolliginicoccus lacisalsi TaxID=2742202 RepID=A0A927J9S9_9ACTN|nr:sigma factor-like helix-turn-helix DNA-binding protein [Lolliginicoccus lacisalsi]MBD8504960.1 hypothetical protein [Lolliginicoccus lacisalsi]
MTDPADVSFLFGPAGLERLKEQLLLLDPREQDALLRHGYGQAVGARTLVELGQKYQVSRERIRQLESKAKSSLQHSLDTIAPGWRRRFADSLSGRTVVHFSHVAQTISADEVGLSYAPVILEELNLHPVKQVKWWYAGDPQAVEVAMKSLALTGPILKEEWDEAYESSELPFAFREHVLWRNSIIEFSPFFVRKNAQRHDRVAAVLMNGALPWNEICVRTGLSANSVRGALDHFDDFISLSKGWWALAGSVDRPIYSSALPAILDILEEHGPQHAAELVRKVAAVHDVTSWRINQCLDDYRIGRMPDGRIWLVEHGAVKPKEIEPARPDYMVASGCKVGVRQKVTYDQARGSGFLVNRWLAWRLGLRATPQAITFDSEIGVELKVTRTGGGTAFSSIRTCLDHHGLVEGCDFVIVLDLDSRTWALRHSCALGCCPVRP